MLGAIGSGKSTLLKLLAGLYKPERGSVLLDGLDIQHIARNHLSEHIGYCPRVGGCLPAPARQLAIWHVRHIGGGCAECLPHDRPGCSDNQPPQGLNLDITEGGVGLGGAKQLVTLTPPTARQARSVAA